MRIKEGSSVQLLSIQVGLLADTFQAKEDLFYACLHFSTVCPFDTRSNLLASQKDWPQPTLLSPVSDSPGQHAPPAQSWPGRNHPEE